MPKKKKVSKTKKKATKKKAAKKKAAKKKVAKKKVAKKKVAKKASSKKASSKKAKAKKKTKKKSKPWFDKVVKCPKDLYAILKKSLKESSHQKPNVEVMFNGRWYPVYAFAETWNSWYTKALFYDLQANIQITSEICEKVFRPLSLDLFKDTNGKWKDRIVKDCLADLGFRPLETSLEEFEALILKAQMISNQVGKQYNVVSKGVIMVEHWWHNIPELVDIGSPESPTKVVVEPFFELESQEDPYHRRRRETESMIMPYVRIFTLNRKRYAYVDVRDIQDYQYDRTALNRIVLPKKMRATLDQVFAASTADLFGDLIVGKHGGMVVMASGGTGVGKTLTAEVFSEYTERPLYTLEVGELGTSSEMVETNLQKVFNRASRWNAVLLFDEADIFLHERDNDLQRNAIVGIFLRLMDYYPGLMFLTTNREDIIDKAFLSRVTLALRYPDLNREARAQIWWNFFELAKIDLSINTQGGVSKIEDVEDLLLRTEVPDLELNGRQIRNMIRLSKLVHPEELTADNIYNLYEFAGTNRLTESEPERLIDPELTEL